VALLEAPTRTVVLSALFLIVVKLQPANAGPALEYEVKAAYLINLFAYVEWPVPHPSARTVCVLGRDPFGQLLDRTAEKYHSFPVTVKRLGEGQSPKGCSILFVAQGSLRRTDGIVQAASKQGVLTVGERDHSDTDVSIILLETNERDRRVTIAVNPTAAKDCGFRISSRLLAIARLIRVSEAIR
jgi:YfiR/HmsC-like